MKVKFTICLLLITMAIISCSKKDDAKPDDQSPNPTEGTLLLRLQQGFGSDDTVYLFSYDANKRVSSVLDSTSSDKFEVVPAYDNAGNLSSLVEKYHGSTYPAGTFKYNADNLLTEVNFSQFGSPARYVYEYTNSVLSKKSYYTVTNLNSPTTLNLAGYFTYEVTNGNITNRKAYNSTGTLLGETIITYTSDTNVFKPLSLLNFRNGIGLGGLADDEKFFNNNLIAGFSEGGNQTKYTYTYNNNKRLTKVVINTSYGVYTRMLSY